MFETKNEKPMWKYIYEAVHEKPLETLFTFDQLSSFTKANILQNRTSLYRANKDLMLRDKKILISEINKGYRLVDGLKQFNHAKFRHKKADRQIIKAGFEAKNLNTIAMSPDQRNEWSQFLALNGSIMMVMKQKVKNIAMASEISNTYVQDQYSKLEQTMSDFTKKISEMNQQLQK